MQARTGKKAEMRFCYIEFSKSGTACFFCSSVNEHGTQGCHFLQPSLIVDGKNNRIFVAPCLTES